MGNGEYELGGQMTYVRDGYKVAKLEDGTIAASITNVFDEFKNLLDFGIDFKTALKSCTINPARVIHEENNIGSIAVGKNADLVVTDENPCYNTGKEVINSMKKRLMAALIACVLALTLTGCGRTVVYTGCEFTSITRCCQVAGEVLEEAELVAAGRTEST